jgi:hypothetical protein
MTASLDSSKSQARKDRKKNVSGTCDTTTHRYVAAVARCVLALAKRPSKCVGRKLEQPEIYASVSASAGIVSQG